MVKTSLSDNISPSLIGHRQKIRLVLISLVAVGLLALSVFYFASSMDRPSIGLTLSLKEQGWIVDMSDANGLARQAGIKVGDRPVEINGQPAEEFLEKYRDYGTVFLHVIEEITVIDSSGQAKSVSIYSPFTSSQYLVDLLTWFIVSFIFWIIGFYVFFKRPKNQAALLLCLCSLVLGLALSANSAAERLVPLAVHFAIISTIIGPWLMAHFFLVLPEERSWMRSSPWVYLIYLPAVITLLLYPLIGFADGQPLPAFRSFRMFEIGAGFLAVVGVAVFNYIHKASPRTRQQMKIVLISCLAALIPFVILSVLPEAVGGKNILPVGFGILFIVLVPLGMGYAVVTQKLLDIDLVIRRGFIYGLITALMALILSAAIIPIMMIKPSLDLTKEILIAVGLGAVATALFGPAKKGIEILVDRFFYKDRYDYRQIIQDISASFKMVKDMEDISRLVVSNMMETLNLAGGCVFTRTPGGALEVSAVAGNYASPAMQIRLRGLIARRNSLIEFPNPCSSVDPEVAYLIPLAAGGKEFGIFCISPKGSRQNFSSNDIFLLQGVASVAAIALRGAMLIRDVSARDTFVSIASHELRIPLTGILSTADVLLNANLPKGTQTSYLKMIVDNSQKLTEMVDDLLNVSRIQSGKLTLKIEAVKLKEALKERLTTLRESSDKHEIIEDFEPDLPEIEVDRDKFVQVVVNLLDNAMKYSPNGGKITLSARYRSERRQVVVSVSDEGIGISPADKDTLFKTFHRIQRDETMGIRGSGLGLYIVKEWTEAMGGEVWLESELNKGSTFFVAVPVSGAIPIGVEK